MRIPRVFQKLFGRDGATSGFGQFGSLANNSIVTTKDAATIQGLPAFLNGWLSALVVRGNQPAVPAVQDMNALFLLAFQQIANILQDGMPIWDAATTYYVNSFVQVNGTLYKSLTDDNTNNDPTTDVVNWVSAPNSNIAGALYGWVPSNNAIDPTFRVDFGAGQGKDDTGLYLISTIATIVKNVTAVWAAGSGQGGLDTGTIGSSAILVNFFAIGDKLGIEPSDFLFSKSYSSPTMPDGYNIKRWIGARYWTGTQWGQWVTVGNGPDRWTFPMNPTRLTTTLSPALFIDLSAASYITPGRVRMINVQTFNFQSSTSGIAVYVRAKGSTAPIDNNTLLAYGHDDQLGPGNPGCTGNKDIVLDTAGAFQYATAGGSALFEMNMTAYMESL